MADIALVTGGAGGIGEAVCRRLASDGYTVGVGYSSSEEKAKLLASEINGFAVEINVTEKNSIKSAADIIREKTEALSLLVNNAGVSAIELFTHLSDDCADRILNVNLKGALDCTRAFLPAMINRKKGSVINISSMWGQCGASCEVDYSASKAGVIGFTKALAKEVAPSGIRVNCVSPGFIMTDMNSSFSDEDLELIKEDIPLGRFGSPSDVAEAVSFLASDKASFITGQILAVNGGMVI